MKPTVINNSNSEARPMQKEQQPNMDSTANAGQNAGTDHSRRFPQFRVSSDYKTCTS